ncbi:MAG: potassium transporter TrkA [Epsilonproteobacteria bacterium]|nr:potassium transporter TrkA [Campylobacterota bacterium]
MKTFFKYLKETTVKEAFTKALIAFAFFLGSSPTYKKIKTFFWRLMNDDDFKYKKYFDFFMFFLVLLSVGILLYDIKHQVHPWLEDLDFYFITLVFAFEYVVRLWVYNDIHKIILQEYEESTFIGREYDLKKVFKQILLKKWEYIKSPFAIIDFLAILPGYRPLRIFRIFVIFRLFKLLRYAKSINTFVEVLSNKRFELFILLIAVSFVTFIGGAIIYVFEANSNEKITSLFDAIYWSLITISTVGYGDITPVTEEGRVLTMILIVVGIGFISFTTSIIASAFTEKLQELKAERVVRTVKGMNNVFLICGYSNEAEVLCEKFYKENQDFFIVDIDDEKVSKAVAKGYVAVKGDVTQKDFLKTLDFKKITKVFVLTNDDISNAFMILSIMAYDKDIEIIALANDEKNVSKMKKAGARYVVVPTTVTALLMAEYIGHPITFEVIDAILTEKKNALIDEVIVIEKSILDGKLVGEIDFDKYKLILFGVLKMKKAPLLDVTLNVENGHFYFNPPFDLKLEAGDILVVMGYSVSVNYFKYMVERSSI